VINFGSRPVSHPHAGEDSIVTIPPAKSGKRKEKKDNDKRLSLTFGSFHGVSIAVSK